VLLLKLWRNFSTAEHISAERVSHHILLCDRPTKLLIKLDTRRASNRKKVGVAFESRLETLVVIIFAFTSKRWEFIYD